MKTIEEKTFDLLEATKLNWSVSKKELISIDGLKTKSFGIFRNDTTNWLGTVGGQYEALQNSEAAEILIRATEGVGLELQRGGELFGGEKIYLQAKLEDVYVGKSNIKRYITCLNSHNGTTSVGFGSINTVVVCENTFHRAFGELRKIRHSASVKENVELAMQALRLALTNENELIKTYQTMAQMPLKDEVLSRLVNKLFKVDLDAKTDDISTRKRNDIIQFSNATQTSINEQGSTLWALFNGVTRYTNHVAAPQKETDKINYIMSAAGFQMSNIAFNEILSYIKENTGELVEVSSL